MTVALVLVGGGLGAVLRWILTHHIGERRNGFPLGTMVVNVVGSFAVGVLVGFSRDSAPFDTVPIATGVLGGFTTFSTWMVEVDESDSRPSSFAAVTIPTLLGVVAALAGLAAGTAISGP